MIDCVIIGMNERPFDDYVKNKLIYQNHSADFANMLSQAVNIEGTYYSSLKLLTMLLNQTAERQFDLNAFHMPYLALFYLGTYLKKRDLSVEIVNNFNKDREKLNKLLLSNVRSIAISTTFYLTDEPIIEIVRYIRSRNKKVKIIVGGLRIIDIFTSEPLDVAEFSLKMMDADYYIVERQGEAALLELVTALKNHETPDVSSIPNVITVKNGEFIYSKKEKENNSLDENMIDWDAFKRDEYDDLVLMRVSRGCMNNCSFCTTYLDEFECSSVSAIEKEMKQLHKNGVKYLVVVDDSFNMPSERFKATCEMMVHNNFNFKWIMNFRCCETEESLVALMKQSGCIGVHLGLESFDVSIQELMNKSNEFYIENIKLFNKYEIDTVSTFIVGFPGETEETVKETVRLFNENPTTYYHPFVYCHYTKTPVNDSVKVKGDIYSWSHETMDWRQAIKCRDYFINNVKDSILTQFADGGFWKIPYLLSQGLSESFIYKYARFNEKLIIENINNIYKTKNQISNEFMNLLGEEDKLRMGINVEDQLSANDSCDVLRVIWNRVLKTEEGDFYELGGTSMDAISIESALLEEGWLLSAADILQNPEFYAMSALISRADDIDWEADD